MPMKLDAIASAFIDLLKTCPYAKITIQMICDHTPASRNSFYYHFKSKEALAEWICFHDYMKYCYPYYQIETGNIRSASLFNYIKKYADFYIAMYRADEG
ncbi:TetR/AcrR family transcriptional regulator, partial [Christensenellaceae bacterium OttesenSCG-928-M15]|nr:TetR/AcrR family transcriptional regulator [Christensenellaceae bacterium OttesenSCG-928-M15]